MAWTHPNHESHLKKCWMTWSWKTMRWVMTYNKKTLQISFRYKFLDNKLFFIVKIIVEIPDYFKIQSTKINFQKFRNNDFHSFILLLLYL